jgi:hypothetical protein
MSDSLWQAPPATAGCRRYLAIRTVFLTGDAGPAFGFVDHLTVLDELRRIAPRPSQQRRRRPASKIVQGAMMAAMPV